MRRKKGTDSRDSRINVGLDPELREAIETIAEANQTTMSGVIFDILNDARDQILKYSRRLAASKRERENLREKIGAEYKEILEEIEKVDEDFSGLKVKALDSEQQMYLLEIKDMARRLKASLAKSISEKIGDR
jgi:hypothetical protein